jgi:hypothetical protein
MDKRALKALLSTSGKQDNISGSKLKTPSRNRPESEAASSPISGTGFLLDSWQAGETSPLHSLNQDNIAFGFVITNALITTSKTLS